MKALDLKQDCFLDEVCDEVSNEPSTLVQRDISISGLNDSTLKTSSSQSTPTKGDPLCNVNNGSISNCDKTPIRERDSKDLVSGAPVLNKSPSDLLVDELFGETPTRSPSDYLLQEVLSSGVLNSPLLRQTGRGPLSFTPVKLERVLDISIKWNSLLVGSVKLDILLMGSVKLLVTLVKTKAV